MPIDQSQIAQIEEWVSTQETANDQKMLIKKQRQHVDIENWFFSSATASHHHRRPLAFSVCVIG